MIIAMIYMVLMRNMIAQLINVFVKKVMLLAPLRQDVLMVIPIAGINMVSILIMITGTRNVNVIQDMFIL